MKFISNLGKYSKEFGLIFIGFYIMGVILAYSVMDKKSFVDVINALGLFLSSSSAIVVFLTIIQQYHFKKEDQIKATLGAVNILQLQICNILDRYHDIKEEFDKSYDNGEIRPLLLDGHTGNYIMEFDFSITPYIAEYDPELTLKIHTATLNYKRFIEGVFRWQDCQELDTDDECKSNYNDRVCQLKEFASALIAIHKKITDIFSKEYPNIPLLAYEIMPDIFNDMKTY